MGKLLDKVKEFLGKLKSQSLKVKIALGISILVIIIAIISAVVYSKSNKYQVLFSNLDPKDAQTVMSTLEEEGIDYKPDSSTNSILVPKEQVSKYQLKLSPNLTSGTTGYELMDNTQTFGMTDEEFKIYKQRMLEGEIARTIQSFDAIESATVHITAPNDSVFVKEKEPGSASVTIKIKDGQELSKDQIKSIIAVVSRSCDNLPEENVVVVDQNANFLSKNVIKDDDTAIDDETISKQHSLQRTYEEKLEDNIIKLLESIVGKNKVNATVNVDLDFDATQKTETTVDPNKVIISQESSRDENAISNGDLSESPVDNNMVNEINTDNGGTTSLSEKQTTNYDTGKSETRTINAQGTVKRITASIIVDRQLSAAEQQQFRETVQNAIGFNAARGDQVSILGAEFDTTEQDAVKEAEQALTAKREAARRNLYITLGVIGGLILLVILILVLRKFRKKKKEENEQILDTLIDDSLIPKEPEVFTPIDFDVQNQKSHLEKEIKKYATEKPEQVVDIIKSWLVEDER